MSPDDLVVHCQREEYDVLVDRTTKWGNPFIIGRDGTRSEVIAKHRAWIVQQPGLMADLPELRGKILGCWCGKRACHARTLSELANRPRGLFQKL